MLSRTCPWNRNLGNLECNYGVQRRSGRPVVRDLQHRAIDVAEAFWSDAAARIPWFREWDQVFEWTPDDTPAFRWFIGGETNLAYACLDAQVAIGNGGRAALIALDENGGQRVFT